MALQLSKIATVTVGSGGASSLAFTNIPQGYTDLKIVFSGRYSNNPNSEVWSWVELGFNSDGAHINNTGYILQGNGAAASSSLNYTYIYIPTSGATANAFGSAEIYIPNYTSSNQKSFNIESVQESNQATSILQTANGVWTGTAAISSFTIYQRTGYTFGEFTNATLYGIL